MEPLALEAGRVTVRESTPGDEPFLLHVYGSTRADELAQVDWNHDQKRAFLTMQFHAQRTHYREHFPGSLFGVIELDSRPAGRLYVQRAPEMIHLLDIALLPEYRGRGVGTAILQALQKEADATRRPLGIYVEKFNPALRLYLRLGFVPAGDEGIYWYMEWRSPSAQGRLAPRARTT